MKPNTETFIKNLCNMDTDTDTWKLQHADMDTDKGNDI